MNYDLSFVLPGIRTRKWTGFYNSILNSFSGSFEVIFIGPYPIPEELRTNVDIRYIEDFGSPVRCGQMGACMAQGKYLTLCSDDYIYKPSAIDQIFDIFHHEQDMKFAINAKLYEGHDNLKRSKDKKHARKVHGSDEWYKTSLSPVTAAKSIPSHWNLFHIPFIRTEYFMDLGGLDARFEGPAMSLSDLSNRMQADGGEIRLTPFIAVDVGHLVGGDHTPIEISQKEHDEPLYQSIYRSKGWKKRIRIDSENWKDAPKRWPRRDFDQFDPRLS